MSSKPDSTPHLGGPGRARGAGKFGKPTYDQAARIVAKFGGENALAEALGISRVTAYRWGYAAPYGTDGLVPTQMVDKVQRAARLQGVVLTADDWLPTRAQYDQPEQSGEAE